jgi:hypothetical protein
VSGLKDKDVENAKTPFQKFQTLARKVVKVSKAELDRKIKDERARKQSKAK